MSFSDIKQEIASLQEEAVGKDGARDNLRRAAALIREAREILSNDFDMDSTALSAAVKAGTAMVNALDAAFELNDYNKHAEELRNNLDE